MSSSVLASIEANEEGHVAAAVGALIASVGAIVLAIGSAGDRGPLTIIGGIVLAVGIMAYGLLHHRTVDYDMYGRLEKLEKK